MAPNGAGKSTLIGQIAGSLRPDEGRVYLSNTDITTMSIAERARLGLGRSFQVSSLAEPLSVMRNVMMGVQALQSHSFRFWKPVARDRHLLDPAYAALERMQLSHRAWTPVFELSTVSVAKWKSPARWLSSLAPCCWMNPWQAWGRKDRQS
ncbi:hypothetical protein HSBAA_20250 [Vreelandella sulfidaeris]|uniref:ABC transporter domain-containing protein n=1 Tax=Vreelandella sulfidaeris TaxID=115553 RepID=A0A455U7A5_9GAMM|nr:hypothetical protein HSBAA_20250 [Halomonas sulfidaeris]